MWEADTWLPRQLLCPRRALPTRRGAQAGPANQLEQSGGVVAALLPADHKGHQDGGTVTGRPAELADGGAGEEGHGEELGWGAKLGAVRRVGRLSL